VTVSLGVAQLVDSLRNPEAFVEAADRKLYEAKHGGRNRVAY
jgi:PleD family two-component response regulator